MPVHHFPGWYELTVAHFQASKGYAGHVLCQALGSQWGKVMAFDVEDNDPPSFQRADYSIAAANAAPEVLTRAN